MDIEDKSLPDYVDAPPEIECVDCMELWNPEEEDECPYCLEARTDLGVEQ